MKSFLVLCLILIASPAWATTLNWTDNSNNETGYIIEQNGPGGWTVIDRVGADVTTYIDAASVEGVYRVRAFITVDGEDLISEPSNNGAYLLRATSFTASE